MSAWPPESTTDKWFLGGTSEEKARTCFLTFTKAQSDVSYFSLSFPLPLVLLTGPRVDTSQGVNVTCMWVVSWAHRDSCFFPQDVWCGRAEVREEEVDPLLWGSHLHHFLCSPQCLRYGARGRWRSGEWPLHQVPSWPFLWPLCHCHVQTWVITANTDSLTVF